jgi:hypothetical protein
MILAVSNTDSFATGVIANTGLGSRTNKSFATGFQGQLIQISQTEKLGIEKREAEAKKTLLMEGIKSDLNGEPLGFPKTKLDFERDKNGNLLLQNGLPIKKAISSWYDIRHMIARNTFVPVEKELTNESGIPILDLATGKPKTEPILDENGAPVLTRQVKVDDELLRKTLAATENLKKLGITSIAAPKYQPGITAVEAFEEELQKNTNSIITKSLKIFGLTLSSFPQGTTMYSALKMVEDDSNQGVINQKKVEDLKRDVASLRAEELFTLKRFKPFGGNTPTQALALLKSQPEKFRPTPIEPKFKPIWENPPSLKIDLGKVNYSQWKSAVVANAKSVNPDYTDEEIIKKFGFDRIVSLGAGWFGRTR